MTYYVEDAVAWIADTTSYDELLGVVRQLAEQLPRNTMDGESLDPANAREMRAAVIEQLRDVTLPRLPPRQALELLYVLAHHGWTELDDLRAALLHAPPAADPPPSAPPPPTDEETVERLISADHVAQARALCEQIAERHRHDEESCMRSGDFGQAIKAEREKLAWLERARTI